MVNELAIAVDNYINDNGIKKVWIAEKLGMQQQRLTDLFNKKNFTIDDANKILNLIDCHIEYKIVKNKGE